MRIMKLSSTQKLSHIAGFALALAAITLGLAMNALAQTATTLHSFANDANGYNPTASLVFDAAGNLYSTASEGGNFTGCNNGCGVVFELAPGSGGTWRPRRNHCYS